MLSPAFRQFISGTDIRGVASEGVPEEPINLTDENIEITFPGDFISFNRNVKMNV